MRGCEPLLGMGDSTVPNDLCAEARCCGPLVGAVPRVGGCSIVGPLDTQGEHGDGPTRGVAQKGEGTITKDTKSAILAYVRSNLFMELDDLEKDLEGRFPGWNFTITGEDHEMETKINIRAIPNTGEIDLKLTVM